MLVLVLYKLVLVHIYYSTHTRSKDDNFFYDLYRMCTCVCGVCISIKVYFTSSISFTQAGDLLSKVCVCVCVCVCVVFA